MKNRVWLVVAALIAFTGGLLIYLGKLYPDALSNRDNQIEIVRILAILAVFMLWLGSGRVKAGEAIKGLMIWAAIGLGIAVLYTERTSIMRIWDNLAAQVVPSRGFVGEGQVMVFQKSSDGHFYIDAEVEQARVRFLVDTGATGITISQQDAVRMGIDTTKLRFTIPVNTANGMAFAAPITLDTLTIGSVTLRDVPAKVGADGLETSLLGMSFLERLNGFRIEGDQLILQP